MLLLTLLLACGGGPQPAATDAATILLNTSDVTTVAAEDISAGPRISGTLEARARAVIRAEAGGDVESVNVEIGDRVTKGQVLATLESTALRQSFASAEASVAAAEANEANARRELERVTRLKEAGALSNRDVEVAEAQLKAASAQVQAARAQRAGASQQLSGATVRAPFDGVVSERNIRQGDVAALGSALFTVIEPSTLRLEGAIPADQAGQAPVGATVRFVVQGMGSRAFTGTVERVSPSVDATTRQIPVLVTIPNQDGTLLAGLFAEGRVAAETHSGLVLPADALDGDHVLRVNSGKIEQITVELGITDAERDRVEIKSGLSAGDQVLVGAARSLPVGAAVNVRTEG